LGQDEISAGVCWFAVRDQPDRRKVRSYRQPFRNDRTSG